MLLEPQLEKENRTKILKQKILDAPYEICIERAKYYTEVYKETEGEHPSIRAAKALKRTLEKMTIYILPEEFLVGNRSSKLIGVFIPIERGDINTVFKMDLKKMEKRIDHPYKINPEDKRQLLEEILPYWENKTARDLKGKEMKEQGLVVIQSLGLISLIRRMRNFGIRNFFRIMGPIIKGQVRHMLYGLRQVSINNPGLVNNVFDVQGHLILGINKIIDMGFKGVKEKALKLKKKYSKDSEKTIFLDSVVMCCDAVNTFAKRFSQLAEEMAGNEKDSRRKEELLHISRISAKIPWNPPTTFYEAMQFLWFTTDIAMISHGVAGILAIGRPDQYLFPFYKRDIENRIIDESFALQLIEELMIKTSYSIIPLPEVAKQTASELGADENAITIGGLDKNGKDAANDLTYLFMDAAINIKNMTNTFSIRVHSKSSDDYLYKVAEVFSKTSGPALFNDDIIVPALMHNGYTIEEARDYGLIGCVEPSSSGNTFSCTSGNDISLTGILELVITNGKIRMMGKRTGLKTGKFKDFKSFEDILNAYKAQLGHTIGKIMDCVNIKDKVYMDNFHNPYVSLTLEGCLENGMDMTQGGAKHNFGSIGGRGIATVTDSLLALKKAVFEDKLLTLKELNKLLNTNFRGKEEIRQKLMNKYPKYGNDNEEVDAMAKWVADAFCEEVAKQKSIRGGYVRPGFFSFGMHVFDGMFLGATPNGRKAGEAISNSMSPCNGCEQNGPTAVIKSYSKIDHEKISNGSSLNLRILPAFLNADEGKRKLVSLLKSWIDLKGMHIQFNVVDDEVLRDAQIHPELHKDLVVRVSGYCAYFTDLGKPIQDDIIERYQFQSL